MVWGCFAQFDFVVVVVIKINNNKVKNVCGESPICMKCKCRSNFCLRECIWKRTQGIGNIGAMGGH